MNESIVQPEPPDPLLEETRAFWRDTGRDLVRHSIETIESTAKQIIVVTGILEGLYFHAITFADLRQPAPGGWLLATYLVPLLLLLISLALALLVFFPSHHRLNFNSSQACQIVYERTVKWKLRLLRFASIFLLLGILAIFFAVWAYLRG